MLLMDPWLIFIVMAFIAIGTVRRLWFWRARETPFYREGRLLCLAHRGVPSLAPENTLPSFQEAFTAGVDGIELDVMETADGVVIVKHDFDLEGTTDGTGYVWDTTYEQLSQLNAAHTWQGQIPKTRIPRLAEVLERVPEDMIVNIELKSYHWRSTGLEAKVVALVRQNRLVKRTIISSFNPYWLMRVRWLEPELRIGYILSDVDVPWILRKPYFLNLVRPDLLHAGAEIVTPEMVIQAHRRGMQVIAWTVNNRPMIAYLKSIGVDGVFTDFPELVLSVDRES